MPGAKAPLTEVVWTEPALANLRAIRAYMEQFNPLAAQRLAESLAVAGNSLIDFPHRGRPVPKTAMRELITAYPYIIRYRVDGNVVVILRVRHSARRPTKP